ncbi:hypothetical protein GGI25_001632 [Coemansia spiralis]|uniref:Uncharacterized protein n=2 Tax=Coemansia TaxID=4863 RepID=A0A9W8G5P4_9FUNG|nr:hypothetical protein GGI25_001632 [Coemansia spiralis]
MNLLKIKSLLLAIFKVTLFAIIITDQAQLPWPSRTDNTRSLEQRSLKMSTTPGFAMPSPEEQERKVAEWREKLVGKTLVDDTPKEGEAKPTSDQAVGRREEESAEDQTEAKGDGGDDQESVLLSSLPQPRRIIRPGSRVTRDLRPNRLNVMCDENGVVSDVRYF